VNTETLPEWPLFGMADDVRPAMARAMGRGEAFALVTLYAVEGGGPRPPGTQMVFSPGEVMGFVSGGCVEGDIAGHAAATLADGEPRHLTYGEGGPWPDIRLLCGARIDLLVEKVEAGDAAARTLIDLMEQRRPAIWRTDGKARTCEMGSGLRCVVTADPFSLERRHNPVPRLIVVGADPTALAIAQLGAQSGMETTLVRPKGPPAGPEIPGVAYRRDPVGQALGELTIDPWTAIAIATHDLETDHEALIAALPSKAGYIGLLGARRRLEGRLHELRKAGIGEDRIEKLHAPIGIPTGGKAPWEVAVSVIAEIMAEREKKAG
jgi:xanthine dehydrogenase accessory factor